MRTRLLEGERFGCTASTPAEAPSPWWNMITPLEAATSFAPPLDRRLICLKRLGTYTSVASVKYDTKNPPALELAIENLKCILLHKLQELPIETLVDVMRKVSEQAGDPDPAAIASDVCAVTDRISEDELTSKLTEIFRPQTADEKPPSGFLAVVKGIFRRLGN